MIGFQNDWIPKWLDSKMIGFQNDWIPKWLEWLKVSLGLTKLVLWPRDKMISWSKIAKKDYFESTCWFLIWIWACWTSADLARWVSLGLLLLVKLGSLECYHHLFHFKYNVLAYQIYMQTTGNWQHSVVILDFLILAVILNTGQDCYVYTVK